jgi:hypothetical protein
MKDREHQVLSNVYQLSACGRPLYEYDHVSANQVLGLQEPAG